MSQLARILGTFILLGSSLAYGAEPTVHVRLEPGDIENGRPSNMIVEIDAIQPMSGAVLEVTPPVGFVVTPSSKLDLPAFDAHLRETRLSLKRADSSAPIGPATVYAHLFQDAKSQHALAEGSVQFKYLERISVCVYLSWGVIGIFIGYGIRLIIRVQQTVPAPAPAPPEGPVPPAPGKITQFVTNHYYLVDCSLTVVIGFLALLVLLKDNHVPDTGLYWYAALGSGVALGALTNSELITKVR